MLEQKRAALVRQNSLIVVLVEQVGKDEPVIGDPNSTAQEMRLFVRRKVTGLCGKLEPQVQPGNSTDYAGGDRGIRTIAILATCGAPTIRLAGGHAFTVDNATDSVGVAQKLALSSATNTLLGYRRRILCMTVNAIR